MSKQSTKNKKKLKEYSKKWYKENKEYMQEFMRNYYKKNKLDLTLYQKQRNYNQPMKNIVRNNIISLIGKNIKSILTLESEKFYFSKLLPEKKIIVFERDLKIFNEMEKSKPKNVSLFLGDVSGFKEIEMNVDFIYLDLTGTFETEKETINDLKEHIKHSKLFAVTFCLRDNSNTEKIGDHQFRLLNKIQELTEINWKVLYGETYKDDSNMITILMENTI